MTRARGSLVAYQTSGLGGPGLYTWTEALPFVATPLMQVNMPFFDPGGMGYDAAGDRFYLASSPTPSGPPAGLWEVDAFGAQTITQVAPWPAALGTALGCAVGDGKVWVLGSGALLHSFDLATKTWDPPSLASPIQNPSQGGLAWAPRLRPPFTYCAPKVNSLGCTPAIAYSGRASASATTGFTVRARSVINRGPRYPALRHLGSRGPCPSRAVSCAWPARWSARPRRSPAARVRSRPASARSPST